jgi:hypothetical protein
MTSIQQRLRSVVAGGLFATGVLAAGGLALAATDDSGLGAGSSTTGVTVPGNDDDTPVAPGAPDDSIAAPVPGAPDDSVAGTIPGGADDTTVGSVPGTSDDSAPGVSARGTSDDSVPDVSLPAVSLPEVSVPGSSDDSVPGISVPGGSDDSLPDVSVPGESVPGSIPDSVPGEPTSTAPVPPTAPPASVRIEVLSSAGGSVRVSVDGSRVSLVAAVPAPGYAVDVRRAGPDEVEVRFESDDSESRVRIGFHDGRLRQEVEDR